MKRIFMSAVMMVMLLGLSVQAHASLQNLGLDRQGNSLIYDTDLDITWYDFTRSSTRWQNQVDWAGALSVEFGGNVYDDWRLPVTNHCYGYYCSGSEMWHLYSTELGNQAGGPLTRTGEFRNLRPYQYWTGINYGSETNTAWEANLSNGHMDPANKSVSLYAIAVRDGKAVVAAPEPVSSMLFVVGGIALGFRWLRKRGSEKVRK